MLPIIYVGILAVCVVAILLTAIMYLLKKKAAASLSIYALCIALLLGGGVLISNSNPIPQSRIETPDAAYTQNPRGQPPEYITTIQQAHTPQPEPEPNVPDRESSVPVLAPIPEPSPAGSDPEPVQEKPIVKSSISKVSSSAGNKEAPPQSGNASTASASVAENEPHPVLSLDESPSLAPDPIFVQMDNPQLAPEPTLTTMTNPTVLEDPFMASPANPAQSVPSGGGQSSDTYIHDFSNGRVLATDASDNGGDPVYHTRDCRSAQSIKKENEIWYNSEQEARNAGRRLCGNCAR